MAEVPTRSARMDLLLRSATQVVADEGLRGLTHRAVDRRAGLPEGSCSAYLRTRQALVAGLTSYVAERVAGDVRALAEELAEAPAGQDEAVERTTRLFLRWVGERELLVARLELTLQASRDEELARSLHTLREALVDLVGSILTTRGKDHGEAVAETLVASLDGVLLGALSRPSSQRRAFVRRSVEVLMAGLG